MKNSYIFRVFRRSKLFGILLICFLIGSLTTNLMGDQVTPFFVWAMFSQKETEKDVHDIVRIDINGKQLKYSRGRLDPNRHILRSTAHRYAEMIENDNEDPTRSFFKEKLGSHYGKVEKPLQGITNHEEQYPAFEQWYFNYLQSNTKETIRTLRVTIETFRYDEEGQLSFVRSKELFSR